MIGHEVARVNQDVQAPVHNPVEVAWIGGHLAIPTAEPDAARGVLSNTDAITANGQHAGELRLGPVDARMLNVQVPIIQIVSQLPPNARSRQTRRLDSRMVNPKLAWSPQ